MPTPSLKLGLDALADPLCDEPSCLHRAHYLAREDNDFSLFLFQDIQRPSILGGIIFHHANREARTQIDRVLGCRYGKRRVLSHGFESAGREGLEIGPI